MPRPLPPGYFAAAPFAAAGPELLRTHTCLGCGARAATWAVGGHEILPVGGHRPPR
jgi:hypothetical protein